MSKQWTESRAICYHIEIATKEALWTPKRKSLWTELGYNTVGAIAILAVVALATLTLLGN
jgi:hypothetical protein